MKHKTNVQGVCQVQNKLKQQINFIVEIDQLKSILRKTKPIGKDLYENDAEHTWHLAIMAVILAEHANDPGLDLLRTIKMLLIHDIVEIDAGDTFAYDETGHLDKAEREQHAADRLFGMLPEGQRDEMRGLWDEFEANETPEARFALALDRFHPMLLNVNNGGQSWKENNIPAERVFARSQQIANGSEALWEYAQEMLKSAVLRGDLVEGKQTK
jgi:putative hydrolases of HD superfamily